MINKRYTLAKRPVGLPAEETWNFDQEDIGTLEPGQILIKNHYISLDPVMRGWINDTRSYIPPVQIGEVMRAGTVGEVIQANNHAKYKVGDYLTGWGGVQQYSITDGQGYYPVDPNLAPLPKYISSLGMPGMTAYFGILEVGKIKEGETVVVSGAAGAVGSVVGQIAKIKGCKVVGIAGGPDKCAHVVKDLGFDACIDYKNENVRSGLKSSCPEGIDVYFDNVGGEILDTALTLINKHARIVICGAISQYNATSQIKGPSNYLSLLVNRARMEGMVVLDYAHQYREAASQMGQWMMEGKLKSEEDIYDGIDNFYETFLRLFSGDKRGKLILKVLED